MKIIFWVIASSEKKIQKANYKFLRNPRPLLFVIFIEIHGGDFFFHIFILEADRRLLLRLNMPLAHSFLPETRKMHSTGDEINESRFFHMPELFLWLESQ